ncbi:hypothetical protein P7M77_03065 [Vibrio parahaemolyticus]|nr:hypothetical protein [Vibrio parahaemolyticus]MDG2729013.1 hypothetical protein [Vibrio parahaemolyticus]HBC3391090.1 hypothetical protein [Vibrio parahaemolyticus]HBC3577905.1 hypothetical protein [Vibrio parahaemolyticus]HBC3947639.1 hypothetical protein [Vibrio parahaemolyticus]
MNILSKYQVVILTGIFTSHDVISSQFSIDKYPPNLYWNISSYEQCDGESYISIYTGKKEPDLVKLSKEINIDKREIKLRKLVSNSWRAYLGPYDNQREIEKIIDKLLPFDYFIACYASSNEEYYDHSANDEFKQLPIIVQSVYFNGEFVGVYKVDDYDGNITLNRDLLQGILGLTGLDLDRFVGNKISDIDDILYVKDENTQSIYLFLKEEKSPKNFGVKKLTKPGVAFHSNYWLNANGNESNYTINGSATNYISINEKSIVSDVSIYKNNVNIDSLYVESIDEELPLIYSLGKIQGDSQSFFGGSISVNRSLRVNNSNQYIEPIEFTTSGPAYVELYQGEHLIASTTTYGGTERLEDYQLLNMNDLTLVINEYGKDKVVKSIPYNLSSISSMYKSGSFDGDVKVGYNSDLHSPVLEINGNVGFNYATLTTRNNYSSSMNKTYLGVRSSFYGINYEYGGGYSNNDGGFVNLTASRPFFSGSRFNFYGELNSADNDYFNLGMSKGGILLNDDNLSLGLYKHAGQVYSNEFNLDYSFSDRFGNYTLTYKNNGENYFGFRVSFDFEKFQLYSDVNTDNIYSKLSYTNTDASLGLSTSISDGYSQSESVTSIRGWSRSKDVNVNAGYSKSANYESYSAGISGSIIFSDNIMELTSVTNPTLLMLESNSSSVKVNEYFNDKGVIVIPINSQFNDELIEVNESSNNKVIANGEIINLTPYRKKLYHYKVDSRNVKFIVGNLSINGQHLPMGTEIHIGNNVIFSGDNGLISHSVVVNESELVLIKIPSYFCEVPISTSGSELVVDFGVKECKEYI